MRTILEVLELAFRNVVTYPLLRLLFHNPISNEAIDLRQAKKILILRYDRIGDMIVTTPIFRNLKRLNPSVHIGVLTSQSNAELIRFSPYVDNVFVLHTNWIRLLKEIRRARREAFDVVLNFIFNRTTSGGILANLIAPDAYKVGQGDDKYHFYFNRLLKLPRSSAHMVETLALYVKEVFGIELPAEELVFEIAIDQQSHAVVDEFLDRHGLRRRGLNSPDRKPFIVFNLSSTDAVSRISARQARMLAEHLGKHAGWQTVIVYAPNDREMMEAVKTASEFTLCLQFPERGTATLLQIASLIERACVVITPDTSIIHFASAVQTPVLGLFTPLKGMHEWLPYRVQHYLLTAPEGQPASSIPAEQMTQKVDSFLHSLRKEFVLMNA